MRPLNLIGEVFDRLTVRKRIGSRGGKSYWLCDCKCGGTAKATASNLTRRFVTSCGCFRREFIRGNQLPNGESGFNTLFYDYTRRAQGKNLPFTLTKEEFKNLTQQNCFYCGKIPVQLGFPNRKNRNPFIHNGIDRMENGEGYVPANCVACCSSCNYLKLDLSVHDFVSICLAVANHQKRCQERPLETAPSSRSDV